MIDIDGDMQMIRKSAVENTYYESKYFHSNNMHEKRISKMSDIPSFS